MPEKGEGDVTVEDVFKDFKKYLVVDGDQSLAKKILDTEQAFKVLYNQVRDIDPKWAQLMLLNPMAMVYQAGNVFKRSEGVLNRWEERFLVLTNCGLLYFKKGDI